MGHGNLGVRDLECLPDVETTTPGDSEEEERHGVSDLGQSRAHVLVSAVMHVLGAAVNLVAGAGEWP